MMKRKQRTNLLGIELTSDRMKVVELRLQSGQIVTTRSANLPLSIDVFGNDSELSAREIRSQLDATGIRTRDSVLCLSAKNLLVHRVDLGGVPDEDVESLLSLEAERAFPFPPDEVVVAVSRVEIEEGKPWASLVGVPVSHLAPQLEALRKARIRIVSITPGALSLLEPQQDAPDAVLLADQNTLDLAAGFGRSVILIRSFDIGTNGMGGEDESEFHDDIQRELKITLRRSPKELRERLKQVRVFGAERLPWSLRERIDCELAEAGLKPVNAGVTDEGKIHEGASVQTLPEVARATGQVLLGKAPVLEFWRAREGKWRGRVRQLLAKGLLVRAGLGAGLLVLLLIIAFLFQALRVSALERRWASIKDEVEHLQEIQDAIRSRRPWVDTDPDRLEILRTLTEAFPETGSIWVRSLEIRESDLVECTGFARTTRDYLAMLEKLRTASGVTALQIGQVKGGNPVQFSFQYIWKKGVADE